MTDRELDAYIDAVSRALDLTVVENWKPGIRTDLAMSLEFGRLADEFSLEDESEQAGVFEA